MLNSVAQNQNSYTLKSIMTHNMAIGFFFFFVCGSVLGAGNAKKSELGKADSVGESLQKSMIWLGLPAEEAGKPICAAFRKQFEIAQTPAEATLHIFADSRYILWINGKYVLRGPCRFDPKRPEYDTVDVKNSCKKAAIRWLLSCTTAYQKTAGS